MARMGVACRGTIHDSVEKGGEEAREGKVQEGAMNRMKRYIVCAIMVVVINFSQLHEQV
jgi:hypothetical protein